MRTHPDAVGSDRLLEQCLECRNHFEQANRKQLKQNFAAILFQLEQRQFHELVADMENGPAIHESD